MNMNINMNMNMNININMKFLQICNWAHARDHDLSWKFASALFASLWVLPFIIPVYCGVARLDDIPLSDSKRAARLFPGIIQVSIYFILTLIVTTSTKISTIRHAARQAVVGQHHQQTQALIKRSMATASLQFLSTTILQVK